MMTYESHIDPMGDADARTAEQDAYAGTYAYAGEDATHVSEHDVKDADVPVVARRFGSDHARLIPGTEGY